MLSRPAPTVSLPAEAAERRVAASWIPLAGIVVGATALRVALAAQMPVPWLIPDDLIYSGLARSFAETGHFAFREEAFSPWAFGPLYPVVIAPAFRLASSIPEAYFLVKVINSLVMSAAAVPAYAIGRRLLDRRPALLVAALAVALPSFVYTARLAPESLAYPAFLVAALAILRVLERPGWERELLALAAIVFATLSRAQFAVLLPAFLLAAGLTSFIDAESPRSGRSVLRSLARFRLTALCTVVGLVAIGVLLASGQSGADLVGGRGEAVGAAGVGAVAKSFVLHLAVLDLYVGILPFAAFLLLCWQAVRRSAPREVRIFCVFTASVTAFVAALAARYLVAVFEGPYANHRHYLRVYDRYAFYVVPLFLVAFLYWAKSGAQHRSRSRTLVAVSAAVALPLSFWLGDGSWKHADSLAYLPWDVIHQNAGTSVAVYAVLVPASAYGAYLFARSRNVQWMLFLVVGNLLFVGLFAQSVAAGDSRRALTRGIGVGIDRNWVDEAVGRNSEVIAIWSGRAKRGERGRRAIWESELMNDSVRRVYYLRERLPYGLPGKATQVRGGRLTGSGGPIRTRYVLTDVKTPVAGRPIASSTTVGLVLYRVDGAVRLR